MTEAALVQALFRRLAQGSSAIGEAQRFNALGIQTTRYHGNGTARKAGKRWYPVRIAQIIANTAYKGLHTYQSAYGAIERQVPPWWSRHSGNKPTPNSSETGNCPSATGPGNTSSAA